MFSKAEGWSLNTANNPDNIIFEYQEDGGRSLTDVLNDLTVGSSSFNLRISCCSSVGSLKQLNIDLARYFKEKTPNDFEKALSSSANLHNPTLVPLRNNLTKALKDSGFFKSIETQLTERKYSVLSFHYEKFLMFETEEPYMFHADIWLRVEQDTN